MNITRELITKKIKGVSEKDMPYIYPKILFFRDLI